MYAAHFGLSERPFSLAPDPRYLYLSDVHREALAHLLYGLGEGGSFVQLTGEIRLLTNLETTKEKLLQVILIGQPELADHLDRPNLRQLAQRVTARYHLRPFTEEETHRYVQHRMEIAGQRTPIFTRLAVRTAHRLSHGIPRLLNTICDRALLGAYATGQTRVKETVVRRAAKEVLGARRGRRWLAATATAVLLVAVGSTVALIATGGLRTLGAWPLTRAEKSPPSPDAAVAAAATAERPPAEASLIGPHDGPPERAGTGAPCL